MNDLYSRQSFLGSIATEHFASSIVAIVGLGGGGSHVAQQLAHLGLQHVQLFDGDRAETSNLNRLVGASPDDAKCSALKVDIAERMMLSINPAMVIEKSAV